MTGLALKPVRQKEAFGFIRQHHRHHNVPAGWLWGHGVEDDEGRLRGVCVVGRPVSRVLDDGYTCEVTRLATDGARNACSMLYGAARRAAKAKGFRRGISYILDSEQGSSLRASGWNYLGKTSGGSWSRPSRSRKDPNPTCVKHRYGWGEWS